MIFTVTLNPALDMISYVDTLEGHYIATEQSFKYPGGKAINVSRMLYNLNIPSVATGFLGGYPGQFIKDWFNEKQIQSFFIDIKDDSRTNIKIKNKDSQITIAGISPFIPNQSIEDLLFYLSRVREGDIVVMGGSIPKGVNEDIYTRIAEICNANKAYFVADIPAKATLDSLKLKPLLIKPNIDNLALMFDKMEGFKDEEEVIYYGQKCIEMGARNVIVSIGKEGSYLFTEKGEVYRAYGVIGNVVNSFNSRDAMIGAFIGVYMRKNDPVQAFRRAAAAASATAFVEDLANAEEVRAVEERIAVKRIK